jgi:hypothetical protein
MPRRFDRSYETIREVESQPGIQRLPRYDNTSEKRWPHYDNTRIFHNPATVRQYSEISKSFRSEHVSDIITSGVGRSVLQLSSSEIRPVSRKIRGKPLSHY